MNWFIKRKNGKIISWGKSESNAVKCFAGETLSMHASESELYKSNPDLQRLTQMNTAGTDKLKNDSKKSEQAYAIKAEEARRFINSVSGDINFEPSADDFPFLFHESEATGIDVEVVAISINEKVLDLAKTESRRRKEKEKIKRQLNYLQNP